MLIRVDAIMASTIIYIEHLNVMSSIRYPQCTGWRALKG